MQLVDKAEALRAKAGDVFDKLPGPARIMAGPVVSLVEDMAAVILELSREIETLRGDKNA